MSELQRLHERMKENVRQKEEKIVGLQERYVTLFKFKANLSYVLKVR